MQSQKCEHLNQVPKIYADIYLGATQRQKKRGGTGEDILPKQCFS